MIERSSKIILRSELKANPDVLYLFGDNIKRKGLGGQAKEMRYEPNAIGICTKKYPSNAPDSFMTDKELEQNKKLIEGDINKAISAWQTGKYKKIVIPPIGVGLAKLSEKAPATWNFLNEQFAKLTDICK